MRFTFYKHRPNKDTPKRMVLMRVLEPSDITASVVSPQDPGSKEGHYVRTKNFFYVFHPRDENLNDPAIEYIQ
ncbi:MAG: hypothetical protein Q9204_007484 [Flavoplaca sp. TL-2023a]